MRTPEGFDERPRRGREGQRRVAALVPSIARVEGPQGPSNPRGDAMKSMVYSGHIGDGNGAVMERVLESFEATVGAWRRRVVFGRAVHVELDEEREAEFRERGILPAGQ